MDYFATFAFCLGMRADDTCDCSYECNGNKRRNEVPQYAKPRDRPLLGFLLNKLISVAETWQTGVDKP